MSTQSNETSPQETPLEHPEKKSGALAPLAVTNSSPVGQADAKLKQSSVVVAPMHPIDKIQKIAAICQAVSAIVVPVVLFVSLYQSETARIDFLRKKVQLEQEAVQNHSLTIDLDVQQKNVNSQNGKSFFIFVEASVKNTGNQRITIDLSEPNFNFHIVKINSIAPEDGDIIYDYKNADTKPLKLSYAYNGPIHFVDILPNETKKFPAIQAISSPGLYFVRFSIETNPSISRPSVLGENKPSTRLDIEKVLFDAHKFVLVE